MPNPKELKAIGENIEQMRIGLDDTFSFECRGCGKCCKNREDILLTPRDLFRIAKHLYLEPEEVVERYCEKIVGGSSHLPLVRLCPRGKERSCPFLLNRRCRVHQVKPSVCSLFPLGRYLKPDPEGIAPPETGYMVWPATCGRPTLTTVRSYLNSSGISVKDEFYTKWNETMMELVSFIHEAEGKGIPQGGIAAARSLIYVVLYLNYDLAQEFLPQFIDNADTLRKQLRDVRARHMGE